MYFKDFLWFFWLLFIFEKLSFWNFPPRHLNLKILQIFFLSFFILFWSIFLRMFCFIIITLRLVCFYFSSSSWQNKNIVVHQIRSTRQIRTSESETNLNTQNDGTYSNCCRGHRTIAGKIGPTTIMVTSNRYFFPIQTATFCKSTLIFLVLLYILALN